MATAVEPFESALDEIVRGRREVDAAEAAWFANVAEYALSGGWAADGFLSASAALQLHCHMTQPVAAATVRLAVKTMRMPEMAAAFAAGECSRAHIQAVASAYTRERAAELDNHMHTFAMLARHATPTDVRDSVKHVTDALDGDGGLRADDEIYESRKLVSDPTMDGIRGSWFLDMEGGKIVNAAIDAQMETAKMTDEHRTATQRRADALVDVCRFSLAYGNHPPSASKRRRGVPNALMLIDIRMFEQTHTEFVADIRSEYASGGRLSQATIERMMCDCDISRVIMDGPSELLDLGRSTRTPSDKQFQALVVRDKHCTEPGCKVPWRQCQPHHKHWWTRGGPTDLDNLELLCWYHHKQRHKKDAKTHTRTRDTQAPTGAPTNGPDANPETAFTSAGRRAPPPTTPP